MLKPYLRVLDLFYMLAIMLVGIVLLCVLGGVVAGQAEGADLYRLDGSGKFERYSIESMPLGIAQTVTLVKIGLPGDDGGGGESSTRAKAAAIAKQHLRDSDDALAVVTVLSTALDRDDVDWTKAKAGTRQLFTRLATSTFPGNKFLAWLDDVEKLAAVYSRPFIVEVITGTRDAFQLPAGAALQLAWEASTDPTAARDWAAFFEFLKLLIQLWRDLFGSATPAAAAAFGQDHQFVLPGSKAERFYVLSGGPLTDQQRKSIALQAQFGYGATRGH